MFFVCLFVVFLVRVSVKCVPSGSLVRQAEAMDVNQYPEVHHYLLVCLCLHVSGHHGGQSVQHSVQIG